jgi:hypothetical protein
MASRIQGYGAKEPVPGMGHIAPFRGPAEVCKQSRMKRQHTRQDLRDLFAAAPEAYGW